MKYFDYITTYYNALDVFNDTFLSSINHKTLTSKLPYSRQLKCRWGGAKSLRVFIQACDGKLKEILQTLVSF